MSKAEIPIVKRSLFSWIFAGNIKLQLLLLIIIVVMVMIRVVPLEMQKRIVNEAINLGSIDKLLLYSGFYLAAVFFFSVLKYLTISSKPLSLSAPPPACAKTCTITS